MLRNDGQHEQAYSPKGKMLVLWLNTKCESINMISAGTNQGKVRFKVFDGGMSAENLIDFLKRLIKDAQRKVIPILDNLRVHHAKKVKEGLQGKEEQIELYYLPPYSLELNSDECLNCDLKCALNLLQ